MQTRRILICLMAIIAFTSCGTQRAVIPNPSEGPLVQNSFFGAKLGDSASRVYKQWSRYRPRIDRRSDMTILYFADPVFGGSTWTMVQAITVADFLSIVGFSQEYKYETDALDKMESVCKMLRLKYGELKPVKDGVGYSFTDTYEGTVVVQVKPETDSKGDDYWACYLMYYWGPGKKLIYLKSLNDI